MLHLIKAVLCLLAVFSLGVLGLFGRLFGDLENPISLLICLDKGTLGYCLNIPKYGLKFFVYTAHTIDCPLTVEWWNGEVWGTMAVPIWVVPAVYPSLHVCFWDTVKFHSSVLKMIQTSDNEAMSCITMQHSFARILQIFYIHHFLVMSFLLYVGLKGQLTWYVFLMCYKGSFFFFGHDS